MSWLCGGSGVSNENTIEAGRKALAHHRWDRGQKLLDRAWQGGRKSHQQVLDVCERSVARAGTRFRALGEGPKPLTLDIAPGAEPDKKAVEKLQKAQVAQRNEFEAIKRAKQNNLHRLHGLAKRYNKRLLSTTRDPVAVGNLCTRVGLHHQAMSETSAKGYDLRHNQRAFDYFSRAIELFERAHLPSPAPVAGRMDVVSSRVMNSPNQWYKLHHKQHMRDATGLLLTDFVKLINMPTAHEERVAHLDALASLLQRDLPEESHEFVLHEVLAPLGQWLCDPSEDAAALRMSVLRVFQQVIHHQPWAKHEAGDTLRRFVGDTDLELNLEHMQVLYPCYEGLIEKAKSETRERYDVLPDLDVMRRRFAHNEKALVQVLVLLDDVVRFGSKRHTVPAAEMVRAIGTQSDADSVQYSALIIFDHLASFTDRESNSLMALEDMAALIGTMKNSNLRDYGIVRITFHNGHPLRLEAADHALYETLGLERDAVEKLLLREEEIYKSVSAIEADHTTVAR